MVSWSEVRNYVREVQVEAKKVVWPERKETFQATIVVIGMVLLIALFLWGIDMFFSMLLRMVY
ncbi:MAG: preprotein translocase subunit SecE [Mariprofundales bacterium]